jgi:hypothetical protein
VTQHCSQFSVNNTKPKKKGFNNEGKYFFPCRQKSINLSKKKKTKWNEKKVIL